MKKALFLIFAAFALTAQTASDGPQFSNDGHLMLPKDYRQWIFLSSGLGMTYGPPPRRTGESRLRQRFRESLLLPRVHRDRTLA